MTLTDELCAAWNLEGSLDFLLMRFVVQTASRAAGCWRLENDHLRLVGFGWAEDMSPEISAGFQAATRRVPLDQVGLGIVKAAITAKPAIGRRDPQTTDLGGSATWIAKFGANTSLAVPIRDAQTNGVVGVLAVSTAAFVTEKDFLWETLLQVSERISHG